jgi:DNA-binding protein HU-beta
MTKAELVATIAGKTEQTQKVVGEVIAEFCKTVKTADKVTLVGFGTFAIKTRAARKGRNPQTGVEIDIPAKTGLTFKASK